MIDTAIIMSDGQITIPLGIRQQLGVKEGDKIVFISDERGISIANAATTAMERIQKAFEGEAQRWGVQDEDDVMALIQQFRTEE